MKKTLFYLIAVFLIYACANNHSDKLSLTLNNGEKWEVNDEMKPHIIQGENVLNDYISKGNTDYQSLVKELESQNAKLIKSCTMKGKSHDELHKWLHPHMELIDNLENAESNEAADKAINDIKLSFDQYSNYFK